MLNQIEDKQKNLYLYALYLTLSINKLYNICVCLNMKLSNI